MFSKLKFLGLILAFLICFLANGFAAGSIDPSGEILYKYLSSVASEGNNDLIEQLNTEPRNLEWDNAEILEFKGHLRFLNSLEEGSPDQSRLFFIRSTDGKVYILTIPNRDHAEYQDLEDLIESKLNFNVKVLETQIGEGNYQFAQ
ncbi:MAG: hypothetical protein HQ541_21390, partial [Mariniphaga sp.]|nr:hypothetical protein [Mariniphaga sp.]